MAIVKNTEQEFNVIRSLEQKGSDNQYTSLHLGSEPRFISPIRGTSGVSNLEEQLLIGNNTITKEWIDTDGNTVINKIFSDSSKGTFYELETIVYKEPQISGESSIFFIEDNTLYINDQSENNGFLEAVREDEEILYYVFKGNNTDAYSLENDTVLITPADEYISQKDRLYYGKSIEAESHILKSYLKTTSYSYLSDGAKITYERISLESNGE